MAISKIKASSIDASASSSNLNIDAGTLYIDASNNRVGVRTTNPQAALEISTSTAANNLWLTGNNFSGINLFGSSVNATGVFLGLDSAGGLALNVRDAGYQAFSTSNVERMRINATGNVGIGTSSPSAKLQVKLGTNLNLAVAEVSSVTTIAAINDAGTNTVPLRIDGSDLRLLSSGAERMRIDATGNVGIGTNNPQTKLQIQGGHGDTKLRLFANIGGTGSTADATLSLWASEPDVSYTGCGIGGNVNGNPAGGRVETSNGQSYIRFTPAEIVLYTGTTTASERVRIDSAGNVGIGTNSPATRLDVRSGAIASISAFRNDNGTVYIESVSGGANRITSVNPAENSGRPLAFNGSNGTEWMRIDSSGNLLVGKSSLDYTAVGKVIGNLAGEIGSTIDNGNCFYANRKNGVGELFRWIYNNSVVGTVSTNGSSTAYNTSSDYRLKENIQPMQGALAVVQQLNPVTYTWKADGSDGQGFIAHELQAVVPDCVTGEKDAVDSEGNPVYQGVDTSFLVATLTKAIQEQQAIINALESRLAVLESK